MNSRVTFVMGEGQNLPSSIPLYLVKTDCEFNFILLILRAKNELIYAKHITCILIN